MSNICSSLSIKVISARPPHLSRVLVKKEGHWLVWLCAVEGRILISLSDHLTSQHLTSGSVGRTAQSQVPVLPGQTVQWWSEPRPEHKRQPGRERWISWLEVRPNSWRRNAPGASSCSPLYEVKNYFSCKRGSSLPSTCPSEGRETVWETPRRTYVSQKPPPPSNCLTMKKSSAWRKNHWVLLATCRLLSSLENANIATSSMRRGRTTNLWISGPWTSVHHLLLKKI